MLTPAPLPHPPVPTVADLTDLVISVAEARPFAGDWQKPAMAALIDDLCDLLYQPGPEDDEPTYEGDGIACDDDDDDGTDLIRVCCAVASDPDGWADHPPERMDAIRDDADALMVRA